MIDVGGSVGTMALSVALRNGGINIVTIEPNARAAALVRQSVRLNRLDRRITVVEAIAAAADGELPFEEAGSATGHVGLAGAASAYKPAIDFRRLVADAAGRGRFLVKIDVGGSVGTMALSVALRNGAIHVVTIEPNARAAALLRQSVRLNRLDRRITVVEAIAAAADGELPFEETGSANGHVALAGAASAKPAIDFCRLVAETAGRGRCLVKIDVEGFETTLLERLPDSSARHNLVVFVELHALGFNGFGDPERCLTMLRDSDAVVRRIDDGPIGDLRNWRDPISTVQVEARWA